MVRALLWIVQFAICFTLWLICLALIPLIYWGMALWPWR